MPKHRKIWFTLVSLATVFLCVFIILLIVTPQLINLETVKKEVKRLYAENLGGEIEYQRLRMAFFPRPHVVISDVSFTIPDNIRGSVDLLKIYPKILPLFAGNLEIRVIHSQSPEIRAQIQKASQAESSPRTPFTLDTPGNWLKSTLQSIPQFKIPSIAIQTRNGRIHFFEGGRRVLALQGVTSQIKHRGAAIEFSAQCQSNFWENIIIEGIYTESALKLNSQIKLIQLRPHAVAEYLFPESGLKLTNARANLTVNLDMDGSDSLQADVEAAIPYMYWRRNNKELKINDTRLQADLRFDGNNLSLNLSQLDLTDPMIRLAGKMNIDPRQPAIHMELEGRQIKVATAQKIALALTENSATVSDIFNILRDGDFQRITLKTQAPDWAHLIDKKQIVIQGNLVGGKISVPVGSLELENVQGDAMIANGILTGENAEAQMGNSFATKGKLSIPLTKDSTSFHVEALVQADLSQLPSVLAHLVADKQFQKELKLFKKFEGNALGMLIIGEDLQDVNVKVMASDYSVNAVYQRIPYPVSIKGGGFVFDGSQIAITNSDARIGKSSLSRLSTRFGWEKSSLLEVSLASGHIDLAQLQAWLVQYEALEKHLRQVETIDGGISLQSVNLAGPLFKPERWQVKSTGAIQNVTLSSPQLPGRVTLAQGRFSCDKNQLKVSRMNTQVGQSLFAGLSAEVKWGKAASVSARSGESVVNLDEVYAWLKSHHNFKQNVKDVPELKGTLAFTNLTFEGPLASKSDQKMQLSGAIEKWHIRSATLPTDIELNGGNVLWRGTRIDLQETDARFGTSSISGLTLGRQWGKIPLFELSADSASIQIGELYPWLISFETLAKAFKGYKATQGQLMCTDLVFKGPVGASKSWQFNLAGDITGMDLVSDSFKEPLVVKTAHFIAKDTPGAAGVNARIDLSDVHIGWEDSQIDVQGGATFSEDALTLEMEVTADRLNWEQIDQIARTEKTSATEKKLNLQGGLIVKLENFTYGSFIWRPVHAAINFDREDTRIVVRTADLCGIQFPGIFKVSGDTFELYFNPVARELDLDSSLTCLFDKQHLMAGNYNLNGELLAKARPSAFPRSLSGNLTFNSTDGRIYRFGMLAKIFALLNVTEIYRGEVPDLKGKGFAYNSITANGLFEDGKLILSDTSIDSPSMGIAIEGDIDIIENKVDLVLLVAPFKTVDRIVKIIPLVGNILGGNLISIPFRAIGDLGDPDVIPLSPTAVGSGLLGILERTLKLPITIIQPVLPGSKDKPAVEEKKSTRPSP
ncbi:MAG: AsmA-like C-terminal domain-containing protein [Desulfobacterales bacterium]|jgi:hypothetical protein